MKRAAWIAIVALALQGGCAADWGPPLTATPSHASEFGYLDVTFSGDLSSLGDIASVTVGGVPAYHLRASASAITVTVQGAPEPGFAEVVVVGERGRAVSHHSFSYDPPVARVPKTWVAFGASLTQGTQSEGIDEHTQTFGVTAEVARAAGVYLALPILDPKLAPPMHASDFNLDCSQKPGTGLDPAKLIAQLTDPVSGLLNLRRGRLAPDTIPRDLAIGGATVQEILRGGSGTVAVLEHVVEEPDIDPGDAVTPVDVSQIDRIEKLDPDLGLSTDLLANDLDPAVVQSDDLHPEMITPLQNVQPLLVEMMDRLGKLHGQYFIANMPSFTFVPNVAALEMKRIASGMDTEASFAAKVKQIDDLTDAYDQALASAMAPHPNLHLIDFRAKVDAVKVSGIRAGGELCTVQKFDGLLSFDELHFTDTGYASYANFIIDDLNGVLGTAIPTVDIDVVHAGDEAAPHVLRGEGFTCVPPPG